MNANTRRLTDQRDEAESQCRYLATELRLAVNERNALTAENARLREALELIAGKGWSALCVEHAAEEMHAMAVKALAGGEK